MVNVFLIDDVLLHAEHSTRRDPVTARGMLRRRPARAAQRLRRWAVPVGASVRRGAAGSVLTLAVEAVAGERFLRQVTAHIRVIELLCCPDGENEQVPGPARFLSFQPRHCQQALFRSSHRCVILNTWSHCQFLCVCQYVSMSFSHVHMMVIFRVA